MAFIPAIHKDTGMACVVNTDYIVDMFPSEGYWTAYTMDEERGSYIIQEDVFQYINEEESGEESDE